MNISKRTLTIVIAILLFLFGAGVHFYSTLLSESRSWQSSFESSEQQVKIWKNSLGQSQAEAKNAHITIDVLRQQHNASLDSARQVIAGLKKNLSNLSSISSASIVTSGNITVPITLTPIIGGRETSRSFAFSDKWLNLSGNFLRDSVSLSYRVRDDIDVIQYWKRDGLFKPRELYTDIISKNPNSEISTLKTTSVRQPPKSRFGLTIFAGADTQLKPTVGIGIGYQLIRF